MSVYQYITDDVDKLHDKFKSIRYMILTRVIIS